MTREIDNSRRNVIKGMGAMAMLPLANNITGMGELVAAGMNSTSLVRNGEVITAAHWGMLKLKVKNGKLVSSSPIQKTSDIENNLQHYTQDMVHAKDRIMYPMVRKSFLENPDSPKPHLRGADEWVRVSYNDAIKLIAQQLKKSRKKHGTKGIFAGSYGWRSPGKMHNARVLLQRFMNATGGFVGTVGDYSTGASQVIMPHVMGTIEVYEQCTSWPVVLENSKVVVIWGANPKNTLKIAWSATDEGGFHYLEKLKNSGKKIIYIDPAKTETCDYLNAEWVAPRPGTDTAMMMGMVHHLLKKGKYNKEFIENYTEGFDKFKKYLEGKTGDKKVKSSSWASKICGIPASKIEKLAETFYDNRTMLMSGWAMQRAQYGEQPHWMLVTLASVLGQIGLPGGGFGLSYHYSNGGVPTTNGLALGGIGTSIKEEKDSGGAAWLKNAAKYSFPVARLADALNNPGKKLDFNGKVITYPKIDFVYWVGGNPLTQHQDTNNLIKGWKKPSTVVVNEIYWTPTARMADIVMPTTSLYERNDITGTGDYTNMNIVPMKQAVKKQHEAKDDYDIFADLAGEFGVRKEFTQGKKEMDWIKEFYDKAHAQGQKTGVKIPKFEEFWKASKPLTFKATESAKKFVRYADFREDPLMNPLGTPSGKIEIYSKTIEKMKYKDCHPHPTWFEPKEWLGMKNKPAELHMLSPHPNPRLHSQMNNTALRDKFAVAGREPIWINTHDAKKKGIKSGDIVRVHNKRGQVLAGAVVTDKVLKGVVRLEEGAWYDPMHKGKKNTLDKNGSANVLTLDLPSSKLANGNISNTVLVNIEKYKGHAPELTIFKQPI